MAQYQDSKCLSEQGIQTDSSLMEAKPPWKAADKAAASSAESEQVNPPVGKMRRKYQDLENLVEAELARMIDKQRQQDDKIAALEAELHSVREFVCTISSQPEPKRRPQQPGLVHQAVPEQVTQAVATRGGSGRSSSSASSVPMAAPAQSRPSTVAKAGPLVKPTPIGPGQTALQQPRMPEQPKAPPKPWCKVVKVYPKGKPGATAKPLPTAVKTSGPVVDEQMHT